MQLKGNSVFTILIFFLLIFVLCRVSVHLYLLGYIPHYFFNNFFGTHVHHFVFGIGLVCLVGFLTLTLPSPIITHWRLKFAAVYGIGLGWIVDEFGMLLKLDNDYYLRISYDAVIIVTIILLNFIYFGKIWRRLFYKLFKSVQTTIS